MDHFFSLNSGALFIADNGAFYIADDTNYSAYYRFVDGTSCWL